MSSANRIVAELDRLGVKLIVKGGRIYCQPAGRLTPELREQVTQNKNALVSLLAPDQLPGPTAPCYACRGTEFWGLAQVGHWVCANCHRPGLQSEQMVWTRVRPAASPFGPGRPDLACAVCGGSGVERLPNARWTVCACRERDFHPDPTRRRDAGGAA